MTRLYYTIVLLSAVKALLQVPDSGTCFLISNPESFAAYDTVVLQNKCVIPELIPYVADTTITFVGALCPWESTLPMLYGQTGHNRRGICYALLIDIIYSLRIRWK